MQSINPTNHSPRQKRIALQGDLMLIALAVLLGLMGPAIAADSLNDTSLLASAEARIDQYRKANATIRVVDQCGQPIPDAKIRVEQIRHSFFFGCAAISLLKHKDSAQEE